MDGAPVLIASISFLSIALLTYELCKFLLKNNMQNYFR